jgi:hypothetical protein
MAHKATLYVDKREYLVIECSYSLTQQMTEATQPAEKPKAGQIEFTVLSPPDSDMFFHEWMQSSLETKDGTFIMTVVDDALPATRTLNFKNAYCIRLYEYFNMHNSDQMHTRLTIAASEISFGGEDDDATVIFRNDLKVNAENKENKNKESK